VLQDQGQEIHPHFAFGDASDPGGQVAQTIERFAVELLGDQHVIGTAGTLHEVGCLFLQTQLLKVLPADFIQVFAS